jgi:hypothetical protein
MKVIAVILFIAISMVLVRAQTPQQAQAPTPIVKTPAEILNENGRAVAAIVAANDISTKLGTGFFLHPSGLLLTNFHVIEGTSLVGIRMPTSKDILWAKNARGFDAQNDLAVLAVEGAGANALTLGNSDTVKVGEPIVVVGNPEGLEQTVSNGLISGIREFDGRKLFQITAPISEGSSGSPVFNERGEVIGVVVASLESGQNVNFAIPINYAKQLPQSDEVPIAALPKRHKENSPSQSSSELYINSMYIASSGHWNRTVVQGTLNNKLYTLQVTTWVFSHQWIFETNKSYPVVSADAGKVKIQVPYKGKPRNVTLYVVAVEPLPDAK